MSDFDTTVPHNARVYNADPAAGPVTVTGVLTAPDTRAWGSQVRVHDAVVTDADLAGIKLASFYAAGSTFDRCDFSGAVLRGGSLGMPPGATYRDCVFDRADLRGVAPGGARFERCVFTDARLEKWLCFTAEFVGCRFAGRVSEVNFRGDVFPAGSRLAPGRVRNEFAGNDFRAAELSGVAFLGGIDLDAQELPDGPRYALIRHARQRIAVARYEVSRWPAGPDQAAAVRYLDFYSGRGFELQEDIFLERDMPSRSVPAEIRQRVLALLLDPPPSGQT
jgi:uncharacterized protein YjbI with pentapeptide repeats